eukprot:gene304-6718_t
MMDTTVINDDFDDYNLVMTSSTSGSDASLNKTVPKESNLSLTNKLFAISSFWFGYNFVWTAISGTIMPAQVGEIVPEHKEFYYSLVGILGSLAHITATPIFGSLSDKINTKFGRRRIWIFVFVPISIVIFFSMAFFTSKNVYNIYILMGLLTLVQITMSAAVGPYGGLLPDLVPKEKHGVASGVQALGLASGILFGTLGAALFMQFLPKEWKYIVSYSYAAIGLLLSSFYTVFGLKEEQGPKIQKRKEIFSCSKFIKNITTTFHFPCSIYFNFYLIALSNLLIFVGINLILPFIQYFLKDILKFDRAIIFSSVVLIIIIVCAGGGTIFGGMMTDKFGPKPMLILGVGSILIGMSFVAFVLSLPSHPILTPIFIFLPFPIIGLGFGVSMSSATVITLNSIPKETMARDFAIVNQFVNVGQIIGALIGGQVINFTKHLSIKLSYIIILSIGCLCFATVLILIFFIQFKNINEQDLSSHQKMEETADDIEEFLNEIEKEEKKTEIMTVSTSSVVESLSVSSTRREM